jgi:hypothetical protein
MWRKEAGAAPNLSAKKYVAKPSASLGLVALVLKCHAERLRLEMDVIAYDPVVSHRTWSTWRHLVRFGRSIAT